MKCLCLQVVFFIKESGKNIHWIFSYRNFCFSLKGISVVENVYLNRIQIAVISVLGRKDSCNISDFQHE